MHFHFWVLLHMSPLLISVFEFFRSYGRAPKMIHLESNFVQFKEELLPKEGNKALLTFPFLHIYWTECCVSIRKTKFNCFGFLLALSVFFFYLLFVFVRTIKFSMYKHAYPMYQKLCQRQYL